MRCGTMIKRGHGATYRGLWRPLSLALGSCRPLESSNWCRNKFFHAPKPLHIHYHVPMNWISSNKSRIIEKCCVYAFYSKGGGSTQINEMILYFYGQKWIPGTQKHIFTYKTYQNQTKNEQSSRSLNLQDGRRRHLEYLKLLTDDVKSSSQELFLNL